MKKTRLLCLLLLLSFLTACSATTPTALREVSFPAPSAPYAAPIGDDGLNYTGQVALYLPSEDGLRLTRSYHELPLNRGLHPAESILCLLLTQPALSPVSLTLSPRQPVTLSGSVCTVNLGQSAAQLTFEQLHTACQAIATTLTELPDVSAVNILIMGRPIALDIQDALPVGTLTGVSGQELPTLWKQVLARRTPVGESPALTPLTATATLFFPLTKGRGVAAEARRLSFPGQDGQQYVFALMDALSAGPASVANVPQLPDIRSLFLLAPEMVTLSGGGKGVVLHFLPDTASRLEQAGLDPTCFFGSIVLTLTTFVPNLAQVCLMMGDSPLTVLRSNTGQTNHPGGIYFRQDFAALLMDPVNLAVRSGDTLTWASVPLPPASSHSPRDLLRALAALPEECAVLPQSITDADLLGLSMEDDTLLIHFSASARDLMARSPLPEKTMAYAMVNTLCARMNVKRVRFFFDSAPVNTLQGALTWSGEFWPLSF